MSSSFSWNCFKIALSSSFFLIYFIAEGSSLASSDSTQWLENFCRDFGHSVVTPARINDSIQQLQELYENLDWNPVALDHDKVLLIAQDNLERIIVSAEEVVEKLAEKAEEFNIEYREMEEYRRYKEKDKPSEKAFTLKKDHVRFYNKSENDTSASSEDVYDDSKPGTLFYYNAKCRCGHQLPHDLNDVPCFTPDNLFSNPRFGNNNVTFNLSAVHIPVDVYNEGPEVLRDIVWSQNMDSAFESLYCNGGSPNVRWSYVATLNGVVRYYPAASWYPEPDILGRLPCDSGIDLFDGRSTVWFVQSMTSPKDVIILIDTSGSVFGLTFSLIRVSVRHVLKSLTSNDFFNVVVFNKEASFLNPDCTGLLPAHDLYKEMLMQLLESLDVRNQSSFEDGFNFAFNVLKKNSSQSEDLRAGCNPVILLFTDGGAEYPTQAFEHYDDQNVRVFTFSVGKHFASTDTLKQMACDNWGKFYTIPSDSATHFQTMEYLVSLSKPLAMDDDTSNFERKTNKWTLPYEDHLGLGTVLTVSRPFFDNYLMINEHKHIKKVAGTAGADVLYEDIQKALHVSQGSATAYMFSTENNGYLIYHPLLEEGRLDSVVMVDVLDLERANVTELTEIRRAMIDQKNNLEQVRIVDKITLSIDKDHLSKTDFAYSYIPVRNSPFSIGLAYPLTTKYRLNPSESLTFSWSDLFVTDENVFTAAYGIDCNLSNDTTTACWPKSEVNTTTYQNQAMKASNYLLLQNQTQTEASCSDLALDNLKRSRDFLLHLNVSRDLLVQQTSSVVDSNVLATFVAVDVQPMLLRIKHSVDAEFREDIESALSFPARKDYFLRPLLESNTSVQFYSLIDVNKTAEEDTTPIPPAVYDTSSNTYQETATTPRTFKMKVSKEFVISQAVTLARDGKSLRPAVTGAILQYDSVKEMLLSQFQEECPENSEECKFRNCADTKSTLCILLDDGGLLLISNQEEEEGQSNIGKFFGLVDGDLMRSLLNDSLFVSTNIDDHQAVCKSSESGDSAARPNFVRPFLLEILKSGWWFTSSLLLGVQSLFSVMVTSLQEVTSQVATVPFKPNEFFFPNYNVMENLQHCVVRKKVFSFGAEAQAESKTKTCNRSYIAGRIPNTNLLFVIADIDMECAVGASDNRYSDATTAGPCPPKRHRVRPDKGSCFDISNVSTRRGYDRGNEECGACQLVPSILLVFLPLCFHIASLLSR